MKKIGNISSGVQETTQDVLDIRANSQTSAQADSNGVKTDFAFRVLISCIMFFTCVSSDIVNPISWSFIFDNLVI